MARVPMSSRCEEEIWNRARAVARGMLSTDPGFTLADLLERALEVECDRLESAHGGPWPAVASDLRRGRRVS